LQNNIALLELGIHEDKLNFVIPEGHGSTFFSEEVKNMVESNMAVHPVSDYIIKSWEKSQEKLGKMHFQVRHKFSNNLVERRPR
jgi:hypothetical protein